MLDTDGSMTSPLAPFLSQEIIEPVAVPAVERIGVTAVQGTDQVLELVEAKMLQLAFLNSLNLVKPK